MTTTLFVIANVKQLRTDIVLEFYCFFSEHLGMLASKIQQFLAVFTNQLEFGKFCRAFEISGGFERPKPPSVRHCFQAPSLLEQYPRNIPHRSQRIQQVFCDVRTEPFYVTV